MHIADLLSWYYCSKASEVSEHDTISTIHWINRCNSNNTICNLKKFTEEDEVFSEMIKYCNNG